MLARAYWAALRTLHQFVSSRDATEAAPAFHAVIANELKYKAPHAHTMLELVYVRWGRSAHIVYFFFAVLTNLLVSLSMLQGEPVMNPEPACMGPYHLPGICSIEESAHATCFNLEVSSPALPRPHKRDSACELTSQTRY